MNTYRCPDCGSKDHIEVTGTVTARMITNQRGEEIGFDLKVQGCELDYEDLHANAACINPGCSGNGSNLSDFLEATTSA